MIKLTYEQHMYLCQEGYYTDGLVTEKFRDIEDEHESSSRHTEHYTKVVQRISDGKFFRTWYKNSVKDEMGWRECNAGPYEMVEVFPTIITKTIYK